jgi:methyl-accepting chemotaxis protein
MVFLAVGIIPLVIVSIISQMNTSNAIAKQAFAHLESLRDVKKNQIERYFQTINDQILTFSQNQMIEDAMRLFGEYFRAYRDEIHFSSDDLKSKKQALYTYYTGEFSREYKDQNHGQSPPAEHYFRQLDDDSIALQYFYIRANTHPLGSKLLLDRADDPSRYSALHGKVHPIIRNYLEKFGYYDIFLVDPDTGDIVYSVFKELDFSTSLIDGPYAQTNFGEAFRNANAATDRDAVVLVDYANYPPSYEAPASFIASPIFDGDVKIGIAMFQMPIERLNAIMGERAGLGDTGETYLVGPDKLMRSDASFGHEHHRVIQSFKHPEEGKIETKTSQAALSGKTGAEMVVNHGHAVLSSYTPVRVGNLTWALLAEIHESEAFDALRRLRWMMALVASVVIFAIAMVALVVTRSITLPIQKGVTFAKALSQGDLTHKLDIDQQDEIGDLARALNQMGSNLNQRNQELSQAVDELHRTNKDLIIAMAEKDQAQAQLQQAQKMESIGNLAGGIAHDFNNILASVIGFSELALDEAEQGTTLEDNLQDVYKAGMRGKDLVAQILAFARQTNEEIKPLQISKIIHESVKLLRSSIPATIDIKQELNSESLIFGNVALIEQVIINLATNSMHAMEEDGGVLTIRLSDVTIDEDAAGKHHLDKAGEYIRIVVSDTGVGIPPEVIDSIFDPYFTTKETGKGTGMGLALVHGTVKKYGGTIMVDSRMGNGTAFNILLPVTKKSKEDKPYQPPELPQGTERLLFVDDEFPITKMAEQLLEKLGYAVTTRTSSVEALELFKAKPNDFDLVVTDMTMPNMTGDKLAVELMKIRRDIPVILCTGYSNKIGYETALDMGIKAFAYKPVVKADLANTIRKVLDRAKGETEQKLTGM